MQSDMENMSGVANGVFILPKPSPKSEKKMTVLGDNNGRPSSSKKYMGKTPPLKPPKKHRSPDDDTEILRCKRRINFPGRMGIPMQQRNPKQMAKRNERERNRVQTINSTFETLQAYLPPGYIDPKPKNKKMSKVEVLHAAINYIRNLQEVLSDTDHLAMHHPQHVPHHMAQSHHLLGHHPHSQLMMVATSGPSMMASTPESMDMPPLHSYPTPQTPSVMVNGVYFNDVNGNNFQTPSPMIHLQHQQQLAQQQQQPQQQQVLTVETCSPNNNSSFSPSSSVHSDPFEARTPTSFPSSSTTMEAPLTPEDEDIIMEWLHDQKP